MASKAAFDRAPGWLTTLGITRRRAVSCKAAR